MKRPSDEHLNLTVSTEPPHLQSQDEEFSSPERWEAMGLLAFTGMSPAQVNETIKQIEAAEAAKNSSALLDILNGIHMEYLNATFNAAHDVKEKHC